MAALYTRARQVKWPCWKAYALAVALADICIILFAKSIHWMTTDLPCTVLRASRCHCPVLLSARKSKTKNGRLDSLASNPWINVAILYIFLYYDLLMAAYNYYCRYCNLCCCYLLFLAPQETVLRTVVGYLQQRRSNIKLTYLLACLLTW